ncbi:MAG TPA: ATP-binding protein [Fimbriimonas sp.]|nr:ATP-binding protein [Fimbriimonas sp.]
MFWNPRQSHIDRLTIRTSVTAALSLAAVFLMVYLFCRAADLSEEQTDLQNAAKAFQIDAPEYPDLAEFKENHPEMVATVFDVAGRAEKSTAAGLPWTRGFDAKDRFLLYGLDVAGRHVVVGSDLADTQRGLARLAVVLAGTWVLLVGVVGLVTARSARAVFTPLRRLALEANEVGGADRSKRLQVDDDAEFGEVTNHLNAMLDRLDRAAEREKQFSSDVAHELRTPLAILRTRVEATLLRDRPPAAYREALAAMLPEIDRLSSISASLLATARSFDADAPPTDAGAIVSQTVERWRDSFARAGQLLEVQSAPVMLRLLPSELEMVLNNLLENALTFSGAGATTFVRLSETESQVTLAVSDQGPGVPDALAATIFDRFVRGEPSRNRQTGGLGIGLALVKKIVEGRGGRIWHEGASPGTTFNLEWPRVHLSKPHAETYLAT